MIRLATRRSALALAQAEIAAGRIRATAGVDVDVVPLSSLGDEDAVRPLSRFLEPGAFTGRLDEALRQGEADMAVHSLKDVPLDPPPGITRPYVLERADPADHLLLPADVAVDDLLGLRIGTSAPRRQSQLEAHSVDAIAVDVRGSIGTRIGRIEEGELDGLFVAAAARLRGKDPLPEGTVEHRLPLFRWPTAPGQGALGLQARTGSDAASLLKRIEDLDAARSVAAERGLLADLGGGCGTPLGATCLPPGHPEGHPGSWTMHVTFRLANDRALRRSTVRSGDPETCRQKAYERIRSPPASDGATRVRHGSDPILLIMDPGTGGPWRDELEASGHRVRNWWPFETQQLFRPDRDPNGRRAFKAADWVFVTSPRAVPAARTLHEETGALPRFAAVGPRTVRALRAAGLPVTLVPLSPSGAGLATLMERRAARDAGRKVLWLHGVDVDPKTEATLLATCLEVTRIAVYRVAPIEPPTPPPGPFAAVLFTSPRMAEHALGHLSDRIRAGRVFGIGRKTAAALARLDVPAVPLKAPTPTALLDLLDSR